MTNQTWASAAQNKFIDLAAEAESFRQIYRSHIARLATLQSACQEKRDYAANLDSAVPRLRFSCDAEAANYAARRAAVDVEVSQIETAISATKSAADSAEKKASLLRRIKSEAAQILLGQRVISKTEASQ